MHPDISSVLISEEEIRSRVSQLAGEIEALYEGRELMAIGILKGSVPFLADLIRKISLPVSYDFMAVSSYGEATESSGVVRITYDITGDISGKEILIVEDIIDTGRTLSHLQAFLKAKGPASVRIVTLLDKPDRRVVPISVDFTGFSIPDEFVVGYGLDYANRYRNLPYVGILKPEVFH
jgi:hypoxanthine phosphoribosyltransferase